MYADRFTFHATHPTGNRTLTPIAEDYPFQEEADGPVRHIRKLTGDLRFTGPDFTYLNAIRTGPDACEDVDLEVRYRNATFWTGTLPIRSGTWDTCSATLTPDSATPVDCVQRAWETKLNILTLPKAPAVGFTAAGAYLSGALECSVTYNARGQWDGRTWPTDCLPDALGWSIVETEQYEEENLSTGDYSLTVYAKYRRELFDGPTPPGGGWQQIAPGQWTRSLITVRSQQIVGGGYDEQLNLNTYIIRDLYKIYGYDEAIQSADNAVRLDTILQAFADTCSLTVVSDLLGINPVGDHPANVAYDARLSYANVVVFQITDLLNADASDNATIGEVTLKELLEALEHTLQLHWTATGTTLRLEHISYYEQDGPDWTTRPEVEGQDRTTYNRENIPRRVRFRWSDDNGDPKRVRHRDFDGLDTIYPAACADGETEEIPVGRFAANVVNMFENPESYDKNGFALVATDVIDGVYSFNREDAIIESGALLNGAFARSVLNDRFFRHHQHTATAEMNGEQTTFLTVRPQRKGERLRRALPAEDYLSFVPGERVLLPLGWAMLEDIQYSALGCYLEAVPVYE